MIFTIPWWLWFFLGFLFGALAFSKKLRVQLTNMMGGKKKKRSDDEEDIKEPNENNNGSNHGGKGGTLHIR